MKTFEKKKMKYESKDTSDHIFKQIRERSEKYFASQKDGKNANSLLWFKFISMMVVAAVAYYGILHSSSFLLLTLCYIVTATALLIVGINIGHDAAHHCVTGNKKVDDFIFEMVFGINGMSGYFWQMRHNHSHHIFPNVFNYDSDLEITNLLLLHPEQKKYKIHKYQHIYASVLYMFSSLIWILFVDFTFFYRKDHANLKFKHVPFYELLKVILLKIVYFINFIIIPFYLTDFGIFEIVGAFIIMHLLVSLALTYTFFISHHVTEVPYVHADETNKVVHDTWTRHQVITTIDFHPDSPTANFIFGGFNLHIAHHLFPEVCHTHYPELTLIIKDVLEKNNAADWYKSFTFMEGVVSHIKHLKITADDILAEKEAQLSGSI
ncbi:MAG: acyl-CoA desaturase [Bacteroidetes bacterium]|nr:acyl-CoA desaturase [Bacteroidota bacterium]